MAVGGSWKVPPDAMNERQFGDIETLERDAVAFVKTHASR